MRWIVLCLLVAVAGCQQQPQAADAPGPFDGPYRGGRKLISGSCDPTPVELNIRVRNSHYRAPDGGMVFDVDRGGDLHGFGVYQASGQIRDGHMQITLRGAGVRACSFEFDMHLVHGRGTPPGAVPAPM